MITMTALAYSFWLPTFWFVFIFICTIFTYDTDERLCNRDSNEAAIWVLYINICWYIIFAVYWFISHHNQINLPHLVNIVG